MDTQKSWCICKGVMFFPVSIGKIESEDKTSAFVRYSEGQLYSPEVWNKEYLERFPTFEEMVEKYAEYQKLPVKMMTEICLRKFPSQRIVMAKKCAAAYAAVVRNGIAALFSDQTI